MALPPSGLWAKPPYTGHTPACEYGPGGLEAQHCLPEHVQHSDLPHWFPWSGTGHSTQNQNKTPVPLDLLPTSASYLETDHWMGGIGSKDKGEQTPLSEPASRSEAGEGRTEMRGRHSCPQGQGWGHCTFVSRPLVWFQLFQSWSLPKPPGPFPSNFSAADNSQQALEGDLWTPLWRPGQHLL